MKRNYQGLIDLLEEYIKDISRLSEKFSNDFHVYERDGMEEKPEIKIIFRELSDKAPRFTPREEDKETWPGYVTSTELIDCAKRTKYALDEMRRKKQ